MPAQYAPVPHNSFHSDAGREMEDAFESESEETTPLTTIEGKHDSIDRNNDGVYDFEKEYDVPPPGSPPSPSARALPNDFGNSNGVMPTSPIRTSMPRPSFFRRAVGAILPQHYSRLPTEPTEPTVSRALGGGTDNDGVFANVMAKPTTYRRLLEDGSVHVVPEDTQNDALPSYAAAQADAVPTYWETTVHAPTTLSPSDMIVDDLPTGSVFIFIINMFASFFFQFIGFLLTYLLHTTHAAKYGSRAGLGMTLIQYGLYSRLQAENPNDAGEGNGEEAVLLGHDSQGWPLETQGGSDNAAVANATVSASANDAYVFANGFTVKEWVSFIIMTIGWFLLLTSILGYWRVKRWETSIRRSNPTPMSSEEIEHTIAVRRNLELVFGLGFEGEDENNLRRSSRDQVTLDALNAEERLARDLRAAGLL